MNASAWVPLTIVAASVPDQQVVLRVEESFEEEFNNHWRDVIATELGDMQ